MDFRELLKVFETRPANRIVHELKRTVNELDATSAEKAIKAAPGAGGSHNH